MGSLAPLRALPKKQLEEGSAVPPASVRAPVPTSVGLLAGGPAMLPVSGPERYLFSCTREKGLLPHVAVQALELPFPVDPVRRHPVSSCWGHRVNRADGFLPP